MAQTGRTGAGKEERAAESGGTTSADPQPPVIDRLVTFLREMGSRVQYEAGRAWSVTNLRVEISRLRHQRARLLRRMGERAFGMLESGQFAEAELRPLYDEVLEIDKEIAERESRIQEFESRAYVDPRTAEEEEMAPAARQEEAEAAWDESEPLGEEEEPPEARRPPAGEDPISGFADRG